jgi:hypothetical protein
MKMNKNNDLVYEQTLEGICEEYGFDIVNREIEIERDDTPVEVKFYGITKFMPKWKAEEFATKLNALGFVPIVDGVYMTPPEGFWKGAK